MLLFSIFLTLQIAIIYPKKKRPLKDAISKLPN